MCRTPQTTTIEPDQLAVKLDENFRNSSLDLSDDTKLEVAATQGVDIDDLDAVENLILIDSRTLFQYNESHVRTSINLSNNPLYEKRLKDGKLQVLQYLESRVCLDSRQDIIIYDDAVGPSSSFALLIYNNLTKVSHQQLRIQILKGGFDAFRTHYPQHCTNGLPFVHRHIYSCCDDETTFLNYDAAKIRDYIYLGALHDAQNEELLDEMGITHILNCSRTRSREDAESDCPKYTYLELQCADDLKQSLAEKLKPAFDLMNDAKQKNGKVLVHCYAGISRSAAIVIAYLMTFENLTYQQCFADLKDKRKIIAPNINFTSQLMKYGEDLEQKRSGGYQGKLQMKKKLTPLSLGKLPVMPRNCLGAGPSRTDLCASAPVICRSDFNPFADAFKEASKSLSGSPPNLSPLQE